MKTIVALACAAVVASAIASRAADASMLMPLPTSAVAASSYTIHHVTFWARPYPSGYTGWRACRRGVRVETPNGWRCSSAVYRERRTVLRSKG